MTIIIETIPHKNQRYETVGDWRFDIDGTLRITVSDTGNIFFNALISVHELWEVLLCMKRGITQQVVDAFDIAFEIHRLPGNRDEPGDDPSAPYHREHCSATGVERILCSEFEIPWKTYEETVNKL